MILTSVMDYKAAPRRLYKVLTDFDALEQLAIQNGVEITNRTPGGPDGVGRGCRMIVQIRGVSRNVSAHVAALTPHSGMRVAADSDGLLLDLQVDITRRPEGGARVTSIATLSARGLTARILMKSLGLAHGALETKFHDRIVAFTRSRLAATRPGGAGNSV